MSKPLTLTPMKAIRQKCLQCCCGQLKEVRECAVQTCALWPYRMGRRPKKQTLALQPQQVAQEDADESEG
jgi:hypothetical protein